MVVRARNDSGPDGELSSALAPERARLLREAMRNADAERRTWPFTVQLIVGLGLFALAPLVPRTHHLFGALTPGRTFVIVLPAMITTVISLLVFRRFGAESRIYGASEAIETFAHYLVNVLTVFGTQMTWPVLWILCPFSTVFLAATKPYAQRLYTWVIGLAHVTLAVLYVVRGDAERAWIALLVGAASYAVFAVIAREGLKNLDLEAERNVAQTRLNEASLDEARRQIAEALRDGVGREITALASALDPEAAAQATAALSELDRIASNTGALEACSLAELMKRIDEKCRPLCDDSTYESSLAASDTEPALDAPRLLAIVRVAQELVRNAIVHGSARRVRVAVTAAPEAISLGVADDGTGLSHERFARATGGLANAMTWLREHDGTLDLLPALHEEERGTALRAIVPCPKQA